jgi:hypothetical protein
MTIDEKNLRELCAAATPGPWKEHMGAIAQLTDGGEGYPLGFYPDAADIVMLRCEECGESTKMTDADIAFVAAARTALPALLDLVVTLRTALLRACDAAEDMRDPKTDAELEVAYSEIAALRKIGGKHG